MKTLAEAAAYGVDILGRGTWQASILWAQRWARAHKVRKAGRDYRFSDAQVEAMKRDYQRRKP